MSLKRELAKLYFKNNVGVVMDRWRSVLPGKSSYDEAMGSFIEEYGNLGKAQVVRLRNDRDNISIEFPVTVEPREDDLGEFNMVLRHTMYNNKISDGLNTNTVGTAVLGKYGMGDFDLLWDVVVKRDSRVCRDSKVLKS